MTREDELAFWQESREQRAARLEGPDEGDRDVLLSHKWAREQLANIEKHIRRLKS